MVGKFLCRTLIAGAVSLLWVSMCVAQPKLVLDKQEISLGTVYNGAIAKAKIKLTNAGTAPLVIRSIRPSCGCTTVRQPKDTLAPGRSDYVEVEFNSSGFRGKAIKYVNVESNDPTNQYATITLTTEVKEELQPTGNFSLLWFGDVPVGKESHLTYTLKNITASAISIKSVKKAYPKMTITYDKKVVQPSDSVVIDISVVPAKIGYFNEVFTLETTSKNQPQVPIRVSYVGVKPQ